MHCNALSHWVPLGAALLAALLPRRLVGFSGRLHRWIDGSVRSIDPKGGKRSKKNHQNVVSLGDSCWEMKFPTPVLFFYGDYNKPM